MRNYVLRRCPRCGTEGGLIYCEICHGPRRVVNDEVGTPPEPSIEEIEERIDPVGRSRDREEPGSPSVLHGPRNTPPPVRHYNGQKTGFFGLGRRRRRVRPWYRNW